MRARALALALFLPAACGVLRPAPPVSVSGPAVAAIAGEWTGSYESRVTGRSGSIVFSLAASGDTAHGDVIMTPRASGVAVMPEPARGTVSAPDHAAQVLTIRFVRAEGDSVRGALAPYQDPECGCTVVTTFTGRVAGDRIRGTFVTHGRSMAGETTGTWSVRRSGRR